MTEGDALAEVELEFEFAAALFDCNIGFGSFVVLLLMFGGVCELVMTNRHEKLLSIIAEFTSMQFETRLGVVNGWVDRCFRWNAAAGKRGQTAQLKYEARLSQGSFRANFNYSTWT